MSKEFFWTDELVIKFGRDCIISLMNKEPTTTQDSLEKFKSSHQSIKEEQPEERLRRSERKKTKEIDWEIVSCLAADKRSTHPYDKRICLGANNEVRVCTIHSVKRLSDNEVFSVGDEVVTKKFEDKIFKIKGFEVYKEEMWAITSAKYGYDAVEDKFKLPHIKKQPQPTKEKTEITFLSEFAGNKRFQYALHSTKKITPDKFEQLGKACEEVLNQPECTDEDFNAAMTEFLKMPIRSYKQPYYYNQQQVDEIEEAAFNEARLRHPGFPKVTGLKYITFQDYKKSLT